MQKLERLLNLTAVLLHSGRPIAASELRERVPGYPDSDTAFHRAFERDKDDLREMGVPLELVEITGADPPLHGYRIPRDRYYLPDPGLEPDELAALQIAASAVRLDGVEGIEALWKLGAGTPEEPPVPAVAAIPTDANLAPLFDAVSRRSAVTFDYRGERRELEPHRIGFERGHWYVRGFDLGRAAERVFRVDRIAGDVGVGPAGAFETPNDEGGDDRLVGEGWRLGADDPVRCVLHVDASHAPVALGHLGQDNEVEVAEDGSVRLELTVTNREAFRGMVLGYLDHAEILEPEELRDDLVRWLRDVPGPSRVSP